MKRVGAVAAALLVCVAVPGCGEAQEPCAYVGPTATWREPGLYAELRATIDAIVGDWDGKPVAGGTNGAGWRLEADEGIAVSIVVGDPSALHPWELLAKPDDAVVLGSRGEGVYLQEVPGAEDLEPAAVVLVHTYVHGFGLMFQGKETTPLRYLFECDQ